MMKKVVFILVAVMSFIGLTAGSSLAVSAQELRDNPEMAQMVVDEIERIETRGLINGNDVAIVDTAVDFSGVPEISAWNMFKTKDGKDFDKQSMAAGAVKNISIEKVGDQYKFIFETQTMYKDYFFIQAEADMTAITIYDQATNKEYKSVPVETRLGAMSADKKVQLTVPKYLEVTVPANIVGRGPIKNFENRLLVKTETNLDKTLSTWLPFPDAMVNPTCTFAFTIN